MDEPLSEDPHLGGEGSSYLQPERVISKVCGVDFEALLEGGRQLWGLKLAVGQDLVGERGGGGLLHKHQGTLIPLQAHKPSHQLYLVFRGRNAI
jgi:hypothetical protein